MKSAISSVLVNSDRRTLIKILGKGALATPLFLAGCGGSGSDSLASATSTPSDSTGTGGTDTGSVVDNNGWASGGTASITDNFPDDSLFDTGSSCNVSLTQTMTEGPCYFDGDYLDDISDAQTGLPMMLCLQLVDANCNPLSGYEIEVWHCDVRGIYSGDTSGSADTQGFNSRFCTGDDSQALSSRWFRSIQVTDASGRVNFKSCFPGWYAGRAIHIHFRVRSNNSDFVVSQFGFSDDFSDEICQSHTDYASRGTPDTHNTDDNIFAGNSDDFLFTLGQNSDGSLLAWKRIIIA